MRTISFIYEPSAFDIFSLANSFVVFAKFYNYKSSKYLKKIKNTCYSFWICNFFKKCGSAFHVESPSYLIGEKYISIGNSFGSLERLRLECWDSYGEEKFTPKLIIGNNVNMNYNVHIGCINEIRVGNGVLFASNIFITDHHHGYNDERDINLAPSLRALVSKGPVVIEDNVWIGENVSILPNLTIGEGTIIGANSVVTKSFPKYSVIGGVPAKIIKILNTNK